MQTQQVDSKLSLPLIVTGLVAAIVGMVLTVMQLMEKIAKLQNPDLDLACDVNSKLSCSTVIDAWQSSVLGVPNAMVGLILFTVFATATFSLLAGTKLTPVVWRTLWGIVVIFAFFSTWFMTQTALVISAMCLWCAFITTATLLLLLIITRGAVHSEAFGKRSFGATMRSVVSSNQDIIVVVVWWAVIAFTLVFGLMLR